MPKDKAPAFQFYPKDFLTDERVQLMCHTERGVYITLLCQCWLAGSLPGDVAQLSRMVDWPDRRFEKFWQASQVRLCFTVGDDGRLTHKRLEVERAKQDTFRRRQEDRANQRWESHRTATRAASLGNATALPEPDPPASIRECSPVSDLRSPDSSQYNARRVQTLEPPEVFDRAARLLERYQELYAEHRRGARLRIKPALDHERACDLCKVWANDRLEKLAEILLTTDDEWVTKTDRGFGVFCSRVSWCDDRLRAWEAEHGVTAV